MYQSTKAEYEIFETRTVLNNWERNGKAKLPICHSITGISMNLQAIKPVCTAGLAKKESTLSI